MTLQPDPIRQKYKGAVHAAVAAAAKSSGTKGITGPASHLGVICITIFRRPSKVSQGQDTARFSSDFHRRERLERGIRDAALE
jgi:hypothetical protein